MEVQEVEEDDRFRYQVDPAGVRSGWHELDPTGDPRWPERFFTSVSCTVQMNTEVKVKLSIAMQV